MEKLLHSKYFIIFLILVLIFIIIFLFRESYRVFIVNQEIKNLEKRIEDIKKSNEELVKIKQYFQSDDFLEKQARLKLNLVKPGEKLIIIKESEKFEEQKVVNNTSNIQKWFKYFFEEK